MSPEKQRQTLIQRTHEDRRKAADSGARLYDQRKGQRRLIDNLKINAWMERYHAAADSRPTLPV